jgi:hypothetical protein
LFTSYSLKPNMATNQKTSALLLSKSDLVAFNSWRAGLTPKGHRNYRGLVRLQGILMSSARTGRLWEREGKPT